MNTQLRNQILMGALAGIVLSIVIYFVLGGKRDELVSIQASIDSLQKEVDKGFQLKANYEKLKDEVSKTEKRLDELIKVMPSEQDRGEMPIRMKKLADNAGIDQTSFALEAPVKSTYYTEYPVKFDFRVGYHSFGQFASLISGYEKIINMTNIQFKRADSKSVFPAIATCRISAFVYNPTAQAPAAPAPAPKKIGVAKDTKETE
ncbi:MAG: type 4a pilus biogenesis protein PilO [Holophagaceae bacterium]|nr:type 4a pilus biogenesis protein PilO [Holophagaceae bacterium]